MSYLKCVFLLVKTHILTISNVYFVAWLIIVFVFLFRAVYDYSLLVLEICRGLGATINYDKTTYVWLSNRSKKNSILHMRNTTVIISEAGTVYPSWTPEFTPGFSGVHVIQSLAFCAVICVPLFIFFCHSCCSYKHVLQNYNISKELVQLCFW
jgi:hypothetical protein